MAHELTEALYLPPRFDRPLRVTPCGRLGKDPGPNGLRLVAEHFAAAGLTVPPAFSKAAEAGAGLARQAAAASKDQANPPEARRHRADRLRDQAARSRAEALRALDGQAIEAALRKIVEAAIASVEKAALPEGVTSLEAAAETGPKGVQSWLTVRQANAQADQAWRLADLARALGILPPTFPGSDRPWLRWPLSDLVHPPGSALHGWAIEHLHRWRDPMRCGARSTLSAGLAAGARPGLLSAQEARETLASLAAEIEQRADDRKLAGALR